MEPGQPSRTARAAAAHRAAHQVLEQGRVFADPLALRILGEAAAALAQIEDFPQRRAMRLFIAARTRFAEDALARAITKGVTQLVVLGAGLDTYAYRNAPDPRLRIFEVDHPSTQAWKRGRLAEAGIALPPGLTFAPVDFEQQTLRDGLLAAGFDPAQRSFFTWLGVVPYLSEAAVFATLGYIAGLSGGAQVVFDYANPAASLPAAARAVHEQRAARVAELGEAWISYFDAEPLGARLRDLGYIEVEDLGPAQIAARYFPERAAAAADKGGHILRAATF
ncbi:MAG: SAM-dependent methyltransferase [Nevskia sp.]|nr:SAM-dependent methyltransferase [Nevskia sp.]